MIKVAGRYIFSILLCFSIILSVNVKAQNIIPNGNFEDGLSNWDTYFASGYSGTLIQSTLEHSGTYAARINVTQVPSNPSVLNAQLKTTNFHIQAGHDYHLSMWLKADRNVDIQLILVKNTPPWTWLAAKTVSLNTTYQHIDLLETNAPFSSDDDVRLAIRCGNEVAKIYVDDVVLTDCTPPASYTSLQTSITGKGAIKTQYNSNTNECILACNNQYPTNSTVTLQADAESGYSFSGWSGACNGSGTCNVTLDQAKFVGAHFSLTGTDNSIVNYRNITDWTNVGYDGAIPYEGNIIDMTQSPYNCVGDGVTNNFQSIKDALIDAKNAPGQNILYFPAGNYYVRSHESLFIYDSTVIRGECPQNTIFTFNSIDTTIINSSGDTIDNTKNKMIRIEKTGSSSTKYGTITNLNSGFHARSNQIVVSDSNAIQKGDFIEIRQRNDTVKMHSNKVSYSSLCRDWWPQTICESVWSKAYNGPALDAVGEILKVIDKIGNILILDRGLHYTYDPKLEPRARRVSLVQNAGIENLKIYRPNGNKDNMNIAIERAYNCWVRNIESSWAMKCHVSLVRSYKCEIKDNYMHHAYDYGGGGHGYGVSVNHRASNCLIENNIFYTLRHAMVVSYAPNGNVFGYNYSEVSYDPSANDLKADISLHGFFPLMNLFEGNVVEYIHSSDWWGPSGPGNTFFRNRASEEEFFISDNSDYQNVIANELTHDPFGFWQDNFNIHSSIDFTTKHSNNSIGDIDDNSHIWMLPNSLYKKSHIPNFCDGFPFPQIGPVDWLYNNSGSYPFNRSKNPAEFRFKNTTDKVECLVPCNFNTGLQDFYGSCDTTISVSLNSENNYTRLYGIGIYSVPSNYGAEIPDFYIELYKDGSLLQTTFSNPVESNVDVYIKISSIILNASSNYEIKVYDKDVTFHDYLGSVTFSGNNPQYYQTNSINGELLGVRLNKFTYRTRYLWNDGIVTNPRNFNQSGDYVVEVTQGNGCVFYDSTVINLGGNPQTTGIHTWIGIDNDWFSNCNWSTYHVPNYNNDVVIPSGLTNYPIINGTGFVTGFDMNMDGSINNSDEVPGKAYCKTLEIENGAELEIQVTNGAELEIQF